MSKAAWAGLLLLGGGLGLTFFFATVGVSDFLKNKVKKTQTQYAKILAEYQTAEKALNATIGQDKAFMESVPDVMALKKEMADNLAALRQINDSQIKKAVELVKANSRASQSEIFSLAQAAKDAMDRRPATSLKRLNERAKRVLSYKTGHKNLVREAKEAAGRTPKDLIGTPLEAAANQAKADYPSVAVRVDTKMKGLRNAANRVHSGSQALEVSLGRTPIDYLASGRQVESIVAGAKEFSTRRTQLEKDLRLLKTNIDRILTDMKIERGKYFHKYKVIEGQKTRESGWIEVKRSFYVLHTGNMGMTVYSKPEGQFEEQAVRVASPPGYSYVGNPRYGEWRYRNGQSFWAFYGQYHFMRSLYWGPSYYRPIYRTSWSSYRHNLRRGRPYYGRTKQYGTKGTRTRTRYKNSAYYKADRARKARSALRSRSRYSGSRYTGGSRSGGGYRGSRYRSSSYGGFGK